jgi:cytochrome c peroxidase
MRGGITMKYVWFVQVGKVKDLRKEVQFYLKRDKEKSTRKASA